MKRVFALMAIASIAFAFKSDDLLKTNLKITVRNELGNLEEGVAIQLFESEDDYRDEVNAATELLLTDEKGEVKFKDLRPIEYYINAEKGDKNNIGAGVKTDPLQEGKLNKITVIIE